MSEFFLTMPFFAETLTNSFLVMISSLFPFIFFFILDFILEAVLFNKDITIIRNKWFGAAYAINGVFFICWLMWTSTVDMGMILNSYNEGLLSLRVQVALFLSIFIFCMFICIRNGIRCVNLERNNTGTGIWLLRMATLIPMVILIVFSLVYGNNAIGKSGFMGLITGGK